MLIDRARPELLQLGGHAGASFPSRHAAAAAASFACFAFLLGRRSASPIRAALTGVAVGIAVGVAASRVALGVHWFTDVVAGLFVGWGWFALCSLAVGGRALRFGDPSRSPSGRRSTTRSTASIPGPERAPPCRSQCWM